MILSDLKRYLQERQEATLADMALHFRADPEVVRAMLAVWIGKGRIERCASSPACGTSCRLCDPGAGEVYRWVRGARRPSAAPGEGGRPES
jgi:hypothetical protein